MNINNNSWLTQLEALIQQKHMLSHPFYKAWTSGQLTLPQLQEYAKEYYHHVKAFPTYISALHSRCEDMEVRKSLLKNLIDEEAGQPNHPDLWRSFGLALGVTTEEMDQHQPSDATRNLVNTFKECCQHSILPAGIAMLYSYESQIPAICQSKISGLKQWYGMDDPENYRYFSVHEDADVEHSRDERKLLQMLVSPEEEAVVLSAAEKALNALESFLSSFCQQSHAECLSQH